MLGIEARSFCALSHPSSPTCILKYKSVTKLLLPSQTVEWHRLPPPTKAVTPICRRGAVESWGTLLGVQKLQVDRHILSPPRWCLSCDQACQGPRQNGLLKRMPSNVLCPAHCRSRLPANPSWCSGGFYPEHSVVSLAWPTIAFPQDDELRFQLREGWNWAHATAL